MANAFLFGLTVAALVALVLVVLSLIFGVLDLLLRGLFAAVTVLGCGVIAAGGWCVGAFVRAARLRRI